jgi:hypothetical protein
MTSTTAQSPTSATDEPTTPRTIDTDGVSVTQVVDDGSVAPRTTTDEPTTPRTIDTDGVSVTQVVDAGRTDHGPEPFTPAPDQSPRSSRTGTGGASSP